MSTIVTTVERVIDESPCDPLRTEDCEHDEAPSPGTGEPLYADIPDVGDMIGDAPQREGMVPIICHVSDEVHFAPADMKPIPHVTCPTTGALEWAQRKDWDPVTLAKWTEFEGKIPSRLLEQRPRVTSFKNVRGDAGDTERFRRETAQRCLLEFMDTPGDAEDKVRAAVKYADLLVAELAKVRK